ncbi:polysaccharide biosynthesis tyrosine autokinase [Silicimonas algicola]|uniref:non-specific protein-tyrosine kinase n=1 Tax=Silicimonas algicola TaxID=1826607 RepID=A0A316GD65_9RHOB|nr:polysaccharide biosynthesis tyrosine autokinase [Silicimonas algicola]AZQ66506.1 polysaccharide biosynthesis tyrosine autokinase [Silicimonas algicola]PWK58844.1 capsular exopolysaccharide synthesis family protein [Silicimonas algicola]
MGRSEPYYSVPSARTEPAMTGTQDLESLGARQALDALWRGKMLIAAIAAAGAILALAFALVMTPTYDGRVRIALETRNMAQDAGAGQNEETEISNATFLTEMQVLRSPVLLAKVAEELNLASVPEFGAADAPALPWFSDGEALAPVSPQQVVERLGKHVQVLRDGTSYVITIVTTSEDPELAAAIGNEVAEQYIAWQHGRRQTSLLRMTDWLETRIETIRAQLEEAEERVASTRSSNLAESGVTQGALETRLASTNDELTRLRTELAAHEVRFEEFERLKAAGSDAATAVPAESDTISSLKQRLAELGANKVDMIANAGSGTDRIDRIEEYETIVRQELSAAIETQLSSLRNIAVRQVELASAEVRNIEEQLQTLSEGSLVLRQQEREVSSLQDVYSNLLTLRNQSDARQPMPVVEASLLATADVPGDPSSPRTKLIVVIGGLLGLLIGLGWIGFRHLTNPGRLLRETVEREFRLPLLAEVPRGKLGGGGVSEWMHRPEGVAFVEAMRQVRTSLLFSATSEPKVVMVTSADAGDGKTTMTIALATLYASVGKRVLVLDGDLRRSNLTSLTTKNEEQNLTALLNGDVSVEESIVLDPDLKFDVLTFANSMTPASVDALSMPSFEALIRRLRASYDLVLIDTPPVSFASDALVIGTLVDASLFVTRNGGTRLDSVRRALSRLLEMKIPLAGVIDNMTSETSMQTRYPSDPRPDTWQRPLSSNAVQYRQSVAYQVPAENFHSARSIGPRRMGRP